MKIKVKAEQAAAWTPVPPRAGHIEEHGNQDVQKLSVLPDFSSWQEKMLLGEFYCIW